MSRIVFLALLVPTAGLPRVCTAEEDLRFAALPHFRFSHRAQAVSIDVSGGLDVIWWEVSKVSTLDLPNPDLRATMYYRKVARDGRTVVNKKELTTFRWAAYTSVLREKNGDLLVTWTLPDTGDDLHWLVVNIEGEVVKGPGVVPGLSEHLLVRDSRGTVYGVGLPNIWGLLAGWELYAVGVYPDPGDRLISLFDGRRQGQFGERISSNFAAAITSEDNILLCARPSAPHSEPNNWKHDQAICCVANMTGQIVWGPRKLELHRDGFRKVPGTYLGGWTIEDTKDIGGGMDLTRVQDGQIVLSLGAYDPEGKLCICQAKLSPEGRFVAPESLQTVGARKIEPTGGFVGQKVQAYRMFRKVGEMARAEFCIYGFDKDGNFYWDTEPWLVEQYTR